MPQTKVFIKTFMCPTGLGDLNASCRFHRAFDNLPEDKMCPTCKKLLVKSINPLDKITMTVMGEEDIEVEIDQVKNRKTAGKSNKDDPDLSNIDKENVYRNKRKQDIIAAIVSAKLLEDI